MAIRQRKKERQRLLPGAVATSLRRLVFGTYGFFIVAMACAAWASLATWSVHDPSLNNATRAAPRNALGDWGAIIADLSFQSLGLASIFFFLPLAAWGWHLVSGTGLDRRRARLLAWPAAVIVLAAALSAVPQPKSWPLPNGLGGIMGDFVMAAAHIIGPFLPEAAVAFVAGLAFFVLGTMLLLFACGSSVSSLIALWAPRHKIASEWANGAGEAPSWSPWKTAWPPPSSWLGAFTTPSDSGGSSSSSRTTRQRGTATGTGAWAVWPTASASP